jgi:hypothetical protein
MIGCKICEQEGKPFRTDSRREFVSHMNEVHGINPLTVFKKEFPNLSKKIEKVLGGQ